MKRNNPDMSTRPSSFRDNWSTAENTFNKLCYCFVLP